MAIETQLLKLKLGVLAWNQWKNENPLIQVDLRDAKLRKTNYPEGNFSNSNIENSDFSYANLSKAILQGANLKGANLSYANLEEADLSDCNLDNADLTGAKLYKAILQGANLKGANLSYANLEEADLSDCNLDNADLTGAKLYKANLEEASLMKSILNKVNLIEANLTKTNLYDARIENANLSGVSLCFAQVSGAKFTCSILTGACIEEWYVTSHTNFENIQCECIYRASTIDISLTGFYQFATNRRFRARLPVNPRANFKPGEFEQWIQIQAEAQQTIDLTFTEGIDWQSFFQSLQGVHQKYPDANVGLQAIEKKGAAFVIRLETAPDADQSAIESLTTELYEIRLKLSEAQGELKTFYKMSTVLEKLADRPMTQNEFNINAPVGNLAGTNDGEMKAVQHNYAEPLRQTPAESAKEIQDLLLQLQKTNPSDIQTLVEQQVKNDPTLKHRIKNALKEGGLETMKVIFPLTGIAIETVRGWLEAEGEE